MNLIKNVTASALLLFAFAGPASAVVLDFEDVTGKLKNGYGGLNWGNMRVLDSDKVVTSGYQQGAVSGSHVAFNSWARVGKVKSAQDFDFNGVYLTGAWRDNLNIRVTGYNNGVALYSQTVVANSNAATWFQFDFLGIDALTFRSFGGTENPLYPRGSGKHFAMDNFTFNETVAAVPLPAAAWLFLSALAGVAGLRRVSKR